MSPDSEHNEVNSREPLRETTASSVTPVHRMLLLAAAFILSRIVIVLIVGLLVGGHEFTDDVNEHMMMVRNPFGALLGQSDPYTTQHPPLLGAAEAIFSYPLQLFMTDFYAIRISYAIYEALCAVFFWLTLCRLVESPKVRLWCMLALAAFPVGWMTSAVMAQDEVIAAFFLVLVMWLTTLGKPKTALMVCGFGVAAAKIFLFLPLIVLIAGSAKRSTWLKHSLAGLSPVVIVYAWTFLITKLHTGGAPVVDFVPKNAFGANIWVVLCNEPVISPGFARIFTGILGLAAAITPVAIAAAQRLDFSPERVRFLFAAAMLWFFQIFYHVCPEYYVIAAPAVLLAFRSFRGILFAGLTLSLPWAVNFFYGVNNAIAAGATSGKRVFVDIYSRVFPIDAGIMMNLSLWVSVFATLALTIIVTRKALAHELSTVSESSTA